MLRGIIHQGYILLFFAGDPASLIKLLGFDGPYEG